MDNTFYVYAISDPRSTEVIYIGKGQGLRMLDHWKKMMAGKPGKNLKLYNKLTAIFRAGYLAPIYEKLIENVEETLAFWAERFWIKTFGRKNLTNLTDGGEGPSGWTHSEETLKKMSAASSAKTHTAETRQKMSLVQTGRTFSAESIQKMCLSQRARIRVPFTPEHCEKISKAARGRIFSAEHCSNLSKALVGKKMSPAWCEKQSNRCLGKPAHPNSRLALLKANIGKPCSAEKRQKIRETRLKYEARRRLEALCGTP